MENNTFIDILIKNIISLYDENNVEIHFDNIEIKYEKRKYSTTYSKVFYIDGSSLTSKQIRSYKVKYKCRCGNTPIIFLEKYIGKTIIQCHKCSLDKKYEHYYVANRFGNKKSKTVKQRKLVNFNDMDESFKINYKKIHLSETEFFNYLPYIYQINNVILNEINIKDIKYIYAVNINNQMKFTSKISFDNGLTYESIKNVYLICKTCNKKFKIHLNNIRYKNLNLIQCKNCNFTNHVYKIHKLNNNLHYQSNLELYFINRCLEKNINIIDGPEIKYFFNGKDHVYISDFYLPEYKYIVEIKSNNIWYKNDVESGKIKAKTDGVNEYILTTNDKFIMLFDDMIDEFINKLYIKEIV